MSPVLWDPFSGEPILVAPRRAERPHDAGAPSTAGNSCPFCEGAESQTPPEVLAVRPAGGPPDGPGWLVRAFANKFPAIAPDEGVHEVIVTTPRHIVSFADATDEEASRAVWAWSERLAAVGLDERRLWPFLFLNQGASAGASLQHSHVQLVGLPFAPPRLVRRENVFATARICPVCADLATATSRMVADGAEIAAWCPAVPPLPGTIWLAPRRHVAGWDDDVDSGAVGRALRDLVARLRSALGAEAVNSWLHQRRPGTNGHYHWHIEVVARLGTLAGLELGTGAIALAQEPEALAPRLRSAG